MSSRVLSTPSLIAGVALSAVVSLLFVVPAQAGPVGDPVPTYAYDPPVVPVTYCGNVDIAYSGNDKSGSTLVAWVEPRAGTDRGTMLRAALVGIDGQLESDPVDVSVEYDFGRSPTECYTPDIAAGPDGEFLVTWDVLLDDPSLTPERVAGQIVESDGSLSGSNFWVTDTYTDINNDAAAWSQPDGRYLVVSNTRVELAGITKSLGTYLDRDGATIGSDFEVMSFVSAGDEIQDSQVARGTDRWLSTGVRCASYYDCQDPWGTTIVSGSSPSSPFQISSGGEGDYPWDATVAFNDSTDEFMVVWSGCSSTSPYPCYRYGRRLSSSGQFIGSSFVVENTSDGNPPTMAAGGSNGYLVAWNPYVSPSFVVAQQIDTTGQQVGGLETVSLPQGNLGVGPQATYARDTGCYVLAWLGNGNPNNTYSPPEAGANVWTRNWNPTGSDPCVEPSPSDPTVRGKGKAGAKSLKVRVTCGGPAPCEVEITGKRKQSDHKGKIVPKTVQVTSDSGKVVNLNYSKGLRNALRRAGGGTIRITVRQSDGGTASTTVEVSLPDPKPVTG